VGEESDKEELLSIYDNKKFSFFKPVFCRKYQK